METPCRDCPFRSSSPIVYDRDAIEMFSNGETPACHDKVGKDRIFEHVPQEPKNPCRGYSAWLAGVHNYEQPRVD